MHYFFQSILMNIFILNIQLTQHTTPIAKFRVSFDAHFCVDRWASLVEKIPFLQYHQDTTWEAKTPRKHPKHGRNTQNITGHRQDTTLRTHHQSATKTPRTTETKLTNHQDTSTKDTTNSGKERVFPKKLLPTYFVMIFFPHHHLLASPSTQHRHNNNVITAPSSAAAPSSSSFSSWSPSSFHQTCPHHQQQQQRRHFSCLTSFNLCIYKMRYTGVYMQVCKY